MLETLDLLKSFAVVIGALLYLLSPLDLIPDWIPIAGWVDDAALLLAAVPCVVKLHAWWTGVSATPAAKEPPHA